MEFPRYCSGCGTELKASDSIMKVYADISKRWPSPEEPGRMPNRDDIDIVTGVRLSGARCDSCLAQGNHQNPSYCCYHGEELKLREYIPITLDSVPPAKKPLVCPHGDFRYDPQ